MCNRLQRGPHSQMLAACCSRRGTQKRRAQQAATRRWMDGCWVANRRHKATQRPQCPNSATEKWFTHAQKFHPSEGQKSNKQLSKRGIAVISVGSCRKCFKSSSKMLRRSFRGGVGKSCDMCSSITHNKMTHTSQGMCSRKDHV
jgi:hypothetical protein